MLPWKAIRGEIPRWDVDADIIRTLPTLYPGYDYLPHLTEYMTCKTVFLKSET